jgi:hypothetical protein
MYVSHELSVKKYLNKGANAPLFKLSCTQAVIGN